MQTYCKKHDIYEDENHNDYFWVCPECSKENNKEKMKEVFKNIKLGKG